MPDSSDKNYSSLKRASADIASALSIFSNSQLNVQENYSRQLKKEKRILKGLLYQLEDFVGVVPVDDVPEAFDKFGAVILVVYVVGVFPNVQNHQEPE